MSSQTTSIWSKHFSNDYNVVCKLSESLPGLMKEDNNRIYLKILVNFSQEVRVVVPLSNRAPDWILKPTKDLTVDVLLPACCHPELGLDEDFCQGTFLVLL
jgi:hypothetical protein